MSWQAPTTDWHTWPLDEHLGALREPVDPFALAGTERAVVGTVPVHTDKASGRSTWNVEATPATPAMHVALRTHVEDVQTIAGWFERDKARMWVMASVKCAPFDGWPQLRVTCELVRKLLEGAVPGSFRELVEAEAMNQWVTATSCPNDLDGGDPEVIAFMDGCKARARGEVLNASDQECDDGIVVASCDYADDARKEAWRSGLVGTADAGAWVMGKLRTTPVDSSSVELDAREDADGG